MGRRTKEVSQMELGIVGTGSMGSMLTRTWCASETVPRVHVCNRTLEKAERLAALYPCHVHVHESVAELARVADWIFLCVKPQDARDLLPIVGQTISSHGLVITTNSAIGLAELEASLPCAAVKLIPSVTQEVRTGALLIMTGKRVTDEQEASLFSLLSSLGQPVRIPEEQLRVYSDMSSCGPAFLADWLLMFAAAAARRGVPEDVARHLLEHMVQGVGKLSASGYTLSDIVQRVAVPGGVTSEGLRILHEHQGDTFDALLAATERRQREHQQSAPHR
ncbi:MAG: NAD(P)-binding domain-containing protein [Firmicutes bacterium]|nr:NAD(P)-binding domain-containing protein [Bacillota bacterium]